MLNPERAGPKAVIEADSTIASAAGWIFTTRQAVAAKPSEGIGGEDAARTWLAENHGVPLSLAMRPVEAVDVAEGPFREKGGRAEKHCYQNGLDLTA